MRGFIEDISRSKFVGGGGGGSCCFQYVCRYSEHLRMSTRLATIPGRDNDGDLMATIELSCNGPTDRHSWT